MKSNSIWTRKFQSVVDNGRNHSIVIDLPQDKGGCNSGPTALEMCVMGFSGCLGTIFAMVAEKMRLKFEILEVVANAEQKDNAATLTDVHCVVSLKTDEDKAKIEQCFELTMKTCPVGVLFNQAGVKMTHEINYL